MDLSTLLRNRRWIRHTWPLPYFAARDVFIPTLYREQVAAFAELLGRGFAAEPDGARFCRSLPGYDAHALGFSRSLPEPFGVFLSRAWHDMLAQLAGVRATGDVDGGFHHHAVGSASGWIHTDLNPVWFAGAAPPDGVNLSDGRLCDYTTGKPTRAGVCPRGVVRALTMIFYLGDDEWRAGDGGETGLYAAVDRPVEKPDAVVPPAGNSLLVFACTPFSYHAFLKNHRRPRNSVILWLHGDKDEAVARWGARALVPFRKRPWAHTTRGSG